MVTVKQRKFGLYLQPVFIVWLIYILTFSKMIVNNSYYLIELNTSITKNIDNFLETKIAGNFPTQKRILFTIYRDYDQISIQYISLQH